MNSPVMASTPSDQHTVDLSLNDAARPFTQRPILSFLRSILTVASFEFHKSRTMKRVLLWLAVAACPAGILKLMWTTEGTLNQTIWISTVYVTVATLVVLLNAMLWVSPILQSELEAKTWLYVVTRPYGRSSLVLGKLLNGLIWTAGAGLFGLLLIGVGERIRTSMLDAQGQTPASQQVQDESLQRTDHPFENGEVEFADDHRVQPDSGKKQRIFTSYENAFSVGSILAGLICLSALSYSALFCAIGCFAPKRSMLIAFSYTIIFEVIVSSVPALINKLTIQYHLRCVLNNAFGLLVKEEERELFFSSWPSSWHIGILLGMSCVWIAVSLGLINMRQYVMTDET